MNQDSIDRNSRLEPNGAPSLLACLRRLVPQRQATFNEALRVAEQQAHRLLQHFALVDGPVPEDLLLELPRISIEYVAGMPTSGCSFWDCQRKSWIIQVNATEPATRQRFTLFHEYKHIVDHGRTAQLYGTGELAGRHAEQAADFFAGCALVSRRALKSVWGSGLQKSAALADHFDVSRKAIEVRLEQIGLNDVKARCAHRVDHRVGFQAQIRLGGQPMSLRAIEGSGC